MNTSKTILGAVILAGLAAANASGQIVNSAHDFSTYAWSGGEICKPCHTPHFANASAGALWNHALTQATFTLFGGDAGTVADLDRVTRLCLSCHDGTVALDSFGGATGTSFIPGSANVGTDLSNDHPIGKEAIYPTTTSTRFNPQNASHQVPGPTGTTSALRLQAWVDGAGATQYVVGCSTCHQVHNGGNPNTGPLLRFSNTRSQMCLACHIK